MLAQTILLSGIGLATCVWLRLLSNRELTEDAKILLAALAPVVFGYVAFWIYFASPLAGRVFSWTTVIVVLSTLALGTRRAGAKLNGIFSRQIPLLRLAAAVFYIALLFMNSGPTFSARAQHSFSSDMPGDNEIPRDFAEMIYAGRPAQSVGGDWLSSDRPPLQTGLALLTLPVLRAAGVDDDTACGTAGVWFQLLWIPAVWMFLRWLGATGQEAIIGCTGLVFTGFLLFNSVYVWPKLGAAALVLLAFCIFFSADSESPAPGGRWQQFATGGALAALGTLAHGGVMFSLLALAPFALAGLRRDGTAWLCALGLFLLCTAPWCCYQKFYAPPGNRLVKWHIAGVIPPDNRTVAAALRDSYRELGWEKTWATRCINLDMLFRGDWKNLLQPPDGPPLDWRRINELAYTFRTTSIWILALAGLPWLGWRLARGRPACRGCGEHHVLAVAWVALTLVIWVALMFFPNSVFVHQGSLVTQLVMLGLLTAWALFAGWFFFSLLLALEVIFFTLTWLLPGSAGEGGAHVTALGASAAMLLFLFWNLYRRNRPELT